MNEIITLFEWFTKAFMTLGAILLFVCVICGLWFVWQLFTITLVSMKLSYKWNRFRSLSPEAKKEALKSEMFNDADEPEDTNTRSK